MFEVIPNFHDANLVGIQLLNKDVCLLLTRYNGEHWEVIMSGVEALQMDEFREGNIVSNFEVIHGTWPETDLLERLFIPPHPATDQKYLDAHALLLEGKSALVAAGHAAVISIVPSYGADLVAFIGGISAKKLHSDPSLR